MLGNYLQQTTSADKIFRCIFFLALRVKSTVKAQKFLWQFYSQETSQIWSFTEMKHTQNEEFTWRRGCVINNWEYEKLKLHAYT